MDEEPFTSTPNKVGPRPKDPDEEAVTGPPYKMGDRPKDSDDEKRGNYDDYVAGAVAAGPLATNAFIIILRSVAGFWFLDPRPEEGD